MRMSTSSPPRRVSRRGSAGVSSPLIESPSRLQTPGRLSYRLCYRFGMAQRHKRSISLPPDLDASIERAAAAAGTSVSGWIADVAVHRLRIEAGRRGVAQWEREHGALTADELAEGLARARLALGRRSARVRRTA